MLKLHLHVNVAETSLSTTIDKTEINSSYRQIKNDKSTKLPKCNLKLK